MTILKLSLILCFLFSSASAFCLPGCQSCHLFVQCYECKKGYALLNQDCHECPSGCDKCKFYKDGNSQDRLKCTGSCYNRACKSCDEDHTACTKCATGYGIYEGQCLSCQGECDKCIINPIGETQYWIDCRGSCKGGCEECINGDTCTRCKSGYVLHNGVCYPCRGCAQCQFIQISDRSYRTDCFVIGQISVNGGNNGNGGQNGKKDNRNDNSSLAALMPIFGCLFIILIAVLCCFSQKICQKKKNNNKYQQLPDENQRPVAVGKNFQLPAESYSQYQQPHINGVPPSQYQQYPGAWNPQQDMQYSPQYYQQGNPAPYNPNQEVGANNVNEKGQIYGKLPTEPGAAVLVGNQPENK